MTEERIWEYGGLTVRYKLGQFRDALAYGLKQHAHRTDEDDTLYITRVSSDGAEAIAIPSHFGGDDAQNIVFDGAVLKGDDAVRVLRLPDALVWFEVYAFGTCCVANCPNLEEVSVGEGTQALPSRLFKDCPALRAIHLPKSLRFIEAHTYTGRRLWDSDDRHDPAVEESLREEALGAPDGVVLYVHEGSYAHEYAQRNGFAFEFERGA